MSLMSGNQWFHSAPTKQGDDRTAAAALGAGSSRPSLASTVRELTLKRSTTGGSGGRSLASTAREHTKADVFRDVVDALMTQKELHNKPFDIDDDDEYDTDIDIRDTSHPIYDQYGRHVYRSTCTKIGINPLTQVTKALCKNAIMMKGQGLGWKDALAISFCLLENVTITVLDLDGNNIGEKGAMYIACMLAENHNIKRISIAENGIGNEGVRHIIDTLKTNQSVIRCSFSGNDLDDAICADIYHLIKDLTLDLPPEKLQPQRTITPYVISLFYKLNSKTLQELDISHNHLTDVGAAFIGQAIAENDYLKILDVSWNNIRPKGMAQIFYGLQNASLKELIVSMNGVSLVGAEAAGEMLQKNRSLRVLDLTNTRVSDTGLGLMAKALAVNDSLQTLLLAQNSITAAGASVFADCLKNNESSALQYVDLSTTHVLQDFMDDLEELKKYLPEINVDVGGIVSTYHNYDGSVGDEMSNKNPLTLLRWYVASKSLRLIDLFRQFDKDNSMTVSREEFVEGLNHINMPLTAAQLERLIDMLDKDGDGEVDYGELVEGDKEHRQKMRKKNAQKQPTQSFQQVVEKVEKLSVPAPQTRSSPRISREENREAMGELKAGKAVRGDIPNRKISTVVAPGSGQQ